MRRILLTLILSLFVLRADGAQTNWVDLGLDAKLRLISSNKISDDGTLYVGLEIKMPKNIKTYWRVPGEAGIPTQIDFSSNSQVKSQEIIWPYPEQETKLGVRGFVYYGTTLFPIKLKLNGANKEKKLLKADIFLGLCANVCVPASASLELEINPNKLHKSHRLRIEQALVDAPLIWSKKEKAIGKLMFNETKGVLEVEFNPEIVISDSVILDNGDLSVFFTKGEVKAPNILSFKLLNMKKAKQLTNKEIRVTFLTENGAYELTKKVNLEE